MKYIDLGLPSGTKWAESNEEGYYTFNEAVSKYGDALPTKEQFIELKSQCQWTWIGKGYKVICPNGKSIFLPAKGYRDYDGDVNHVNHVDRCGNYYSSTPYGLNDALYLAFNCIGVEIYDDNRCYGFSVRLIKSK